LGSVTRMPLLSDAADSHWPTLLHVTHWKAGSQWIRKILASCVPDRIVTAQHGMPQFLDKPVQPGMVYTTLYITREEFARTAVPPNTKLFVVIRDLRDTLVSWYYSLKYNHVNDHASIAMARVTLNSLDVEAGLLWALNQEGFSACASIPGLFNAVD
jgi:hypothetical protein